jgi:hypothetical protein
MPDSNAIRNTREWAELDSAVDVREYYRENHASPEIQRIVSLENRKFGSVIEKMLREIFDLTKPESSKHDAIFRRLGLQDNKIYIKAARYWAGTDNCKWQHLEPDYDYTHIIFVLVDFNSLRTWIAPKSDLFSGGFLTPQGQQGYWGDKQTLLDSGYLHEIHDETDLSNFLP